MVVVDEEAFRDLPGAIAIYRAGQARILGDVAGTMAHARRALELVGEEDHFGRGAAAAFLGLAYWTGGDLDAAQRWYADGMASLEKAGYLSDVIGGAITLADIRITQGRLREAMSTYERGLRVATEHAAPALRGAADMHVGMSQICYERNDLDAAMQHLLTSRELGEHAGLPPNRYRWRVAMARIRAAEGDLGGALDLLNEADRLYVSDFSPDVRPVPALRARVWIAQGRWGEALGWARERGLSVEDDLSYLREFEHLTLARVLLARDRGRACRRLHRRGDPTVGATPASGGGGGEDRERSGDPGPAGACSAGARGHPCRACIPATRAVVWLSRRATSEPSSMRAHPSPPC